MQPQDDQQNSPQIPPADNSVPTFSPNDPSFTNAGQVSNPQDFTFQIPKADDQRQTQPVPASQPPAAPSSYPEASQSPVNFQTQPPLEPSQQVADPVQTPAAAPPEVPQAPSFDTVSQPPAPQAPAAPMPDMHEPPIFMREDGPASTVNPVPQTPIPPLGGPPPFSAGGQAPQDPNLQPMQRPVQSASNLSQVTIPRRKQSSLIKLIIFAVLGLLMAGLLVWAAIAVIGSRSGDGSSNETPTAEVRNNDYESEQLGFTTQYPNDWTQEQSQEDGLDVVTFSHPKIREESKTALAEVAVIRLTEAQMKKIKNEETFYSTYQKAITDGFDNYSEISAEELTVSELPAKKVTADIAQKGEQDHAIFHFVYAKTDGFIIVAYGDKAQFKSLENQLELIVEKFKSTIPAADDTATE